MKIIIISQYNIFSSIGGTEYYVDMLIKGLVGKGHDVVFITMGKQEIELQTENCYHQQFKYKIIYLPAVTFTDREIRQRIVSSSWYKILPILVQENPDVIHVHTYTTFFNIRHFEKCKPLYNNIFFTAHIPAHFCPQGDLIKFNKKPCDGHLYSRCTFCLFTTGIKAGLSNIVYPYWKKVLLRLQNFNRLGINLVCVSDWQKQHILNNGFSEDRVFVIRQAIVIDNYAHEQLNYSNPDFTIGYFGRLSSEKGSPLLLEVISKMLNSSKCRFVLGIPLENCDLKYVCALNKLCKQAGDRILIMDNITATNKEIFFNKIDCLLIPSFFVETGPIVLLEAMAFDKPVVAPNVGGPMEFKKDFNDYIINYDWNDSASLIQSLEMIRKRKTLIPNNRQLLKDKEIEFIQHHENIYCCAIV